MITADWLRDRLTGNAVRDRSVLVWILLGVALLAVLNLPEPLALRGKALVRESLAPLQELVTGITQSSRQWIGAVRRLGEMALANQQMAAELTELRSELRYLAGLEEENAALRDQLGFLQRPERQLVPAEIIGRDISGWWQTIRIGQGLVHGIDNDMAMVTPDGLVGHTMNVSAGTADVLLITDPTCRVSAIIPRVNVHGIVSGRGVPWRGQPLLQMDFINKDVTLEPGDEVVTSGLGGRYPRGIVIGRVERVERDESGLYQRADIVPAAEIGRLLYGFIIAETMDPVDAVFRRHGNGGTP